MIRYNHKQISSRNPNKPSKSPLFSIMKLAIAAVSGVLFQFAFRFRFNPPSLFFGIGGVGFWRMLLLPPAANADENQWDAHGLPADIVVKLNKLSRFKRYKVSAIELLDNVNSIVIGLDDSFFKMVSLRVGSVYTKSQLQKELQTLANCGFFEKINLESKTNSDGTLGLTLPFTEFTWRKPEHLRYINVGLIPPQSRADNMNVKEKVEYMLKCVWDFCGRVERTRECMLPSSVHGEILQMLVGEENVSARMLNNIRDKVEKWYHDEGYACAQVVNIGNLNTNEFVVEVVEGDITRVVIQFLDELGNVCEGEGNNNTQIEAVKRQLPDQLQRGNVFNVEVAKQALGNIYSLSLFSYIEIEPRLNEEYQRGVIVEIKLKEQEHISAEVISY